MADGVCDEPLCRHDLHYRYRNIETNIDTHLNFIENRLNEYAAKALLVHHQFGGDPAEAQRQLNAWVRLYSHYLEETGKPPLPDGYAVRLCAVWGGDQ